MTDRKIMSLFKRAVEADKRAANRTRDKAARARRLQLDDDILEVVIQYMNGEFTNCNRPKCHEKLTLSEALRPLKACEVHRSKATKTMQKCRSRVKDLIEEKKLKLWIMQVRCYSVALLLLPICTFSMGKTRGRIAPVQSAMIHMYPPWYARTIVYSN